MMKFLLLVGLIVVVIHLLKRAVSRTSGSRDAAPAAQEFMVQLRALRRQPAAKRERCRRRPFLLRRSTPHRGTPLAAMPWLC